jgi:hypothetical protein
MSVKLVSWDIPAREERVDGDRAATVDAVPVGAACPPRCRECLFGGEYILLKGYEDFLDLRL